MTDAIAMTGGCMCGAVRYQTSGEPVMVTHCHCHSCRKHNGAAVATLAGFKADQVRFTGNERTFYSSSPGVNRAFCGNCGTPLTWEGDAGELGPFCEIHISTFDDPVALVPTAHAFEADRIPWFDVADRLPRYAGGILGNQPTRHGPDPALD